ncbi:MAG: hypothetical protein A2039_01375 [Candidatus Melainabacteria bacterium GWA2_34_9]|nr:MAG: hypothetical protein A2039_01375 [Candidatus Melainabacteria bacterium GWA2_34_9]
MQKGFTLAETLITMAVIAIVMTISIPMVMVSTDDVKPLFKKAYKTVDTVVNEIINDSAFYPNGLFTNNTFCNNFFSKLSTIGYDPNNCSNTFVSVVPDPTIPIVGVSVATTSNGMQWYSVEDDFEVANCDNMATGIDVSRSCIRIYVDVNGVNKGKNTNINGAGYLPDIFLIYVTDTGQVAVETSTMNTYDEAYMLEH